MGADGSDRRLLDLREYLAGTFGASPGSLSEDEALMGGLLDSIALLTLITHLEDRYGIRIGAHEVGPENFGTLRALAEFVERKAPGA
jgi:acyl carrier protein